MFFWRPFGERFALCYQTVVCLSVCLSCPVRDVGVLYSGQSVLRIKMKLGMQVGFGPGHIVLDGDAAPPPLKGHSPQFSSNVRCGQTTEWMKTPLGTEVDLSPGHIVLDGVPAPRERGTAAPIFSAHICCSHGRPSQLLLSSCYLLVCLLHVHVFFYTFSDFSG